MRGGLIGCCASGDGGLWLDAIAHWVSQAHPAGWSGRDQCQTPTVQEGEGDCFACCPDDASCPQKSASILVFLFFSCCLDCSDARETLSCHSILPIRKRDRFRFRLFKFYSASATDRSAKRNIHPSIHPSFLPYPLLPIIRQTDPTELTRQADSSARRSRLRVTTRNKTHHLHTRTLVQVFRSKSTCIQLFRHPRTSCMSGARRAEDDHI